MSLNNVRVIKNKNNYNILEPVNRFNFDNLINPSTLSKEDFKIFFINCHELINEKTYVLNPRTSDYFPEFEHKKSSKLNILKPMSGGRTSNLGETNAINTLKIRNMYGGKTSFYSNPEETKNLIRSIENNYNFDINQKERLNYLLDKHSVYTKKLNKLNAHLKSLII